MFELKNYFKYNILTSLKEKILSGDYYLYLSSTENNNTPLYDTLREDNDSLSDIISLYKILPSDIEYGIKINHWTNNTVYYPYVDTINLKTKNYYVTVPDTTYNHIDVFVCIENNNSSNSTVPPYSNTGTENEFIVTSDGYVWKHLYRLTDWENDKFTTTTHIRIDASAVAGVSRSNSEFGGIEKILITKTGGSFINAVNLELNSQFNISDVDFSDRRLTLSTDQLQRGLAKDSGETAIYNNDYMIYLFNPSTLQYIGSYTIENYTYTSSLITLETCEQLDDTTNIQGSIYKILPKIKIIGNGSDLVVMPILDIITKQITSIEIVDAGDSYSHISLSSINGYEYEPVYSSPGGLGFDILKDLNCSDLLLSKQILSSGKAVYESGTGEIDVETLTIGSGNSSLLSGPQENIITNFMSEMADSLVYKFGLLYDVATDVNAKLKTPDSDDKQNLSGCHVYTIFQGDDYGSPNVLTNSVDNFVNNEYVCQTNSNGDVIAYGKIISVKYYSSLASYARGVSASQYQQIVLKCNRPRIVVKMYKGVFVGNAGILKRYDINNNTVTNTAWKVGSTINSDIRQNRGMVLYTENTDPIRLTTDSSATFKLIITI